ncbi:MAG: hypothetical protein ACYDBQ_02055 [Thermoplasmatota archaeon]
MVSARPFAWLCLMALAGCTTTGPVPTGNGTDCPPSYSEAAWTELAAFNATHGSTPDAAPAGLPFAGPRPHPLAALTTLSWSVANTVVVDNETYAAPGMGLNLGADGTVSGWADNRTTPDMVQSSLHAFLANLTQGTPDAWATWEQTLAASASFAGGRIRGPEPGGTTWHSVYAYHVHITGPYQLDRLYAANGSAGRTPTTDPIGRVTQQRGPWSFGFSLPVHTVHLEDGDALQVDAFGRATLELAAGQPSPQSVVDRFSGDARGAHLAVAGPTVANVTSAVVC